MSPSNYDNQLIYFSVRFYQLLLITYPAKFRREYSPDMLQVFGDYCRFTWQRNGISGMITLWMRTMLDYVQSVVEEHTQRGTDMNKDTFVKISAYTWMVSGVLFALGTLLGILSDTPWGTRFLVVYGTRLSDISFIVMGFTNLLLLISLIGLLIQYGAVAGFAARAALWVAILGGISSSIGLVGLYLKIDSMWLLWMMGYGVMFAGILVFGVYALHRQVLPRLNYAPLLAGIWLPLLWLTNFIPIPFEIIEPYNQVIFFTIFCLTGLGCFLLGLAMQAKKPAPIIAA